MKKQKNLTILIVSALLCSLSFSAYAAVIPDDLANKLGKPGLDLCLILQMVANIKNLVLEIAGGIAILMIIVSGILFIISRGTADKDKLSLAKKSLSGAITGLVIVILAWLIVSTIIVALGLNSANMWTINC